MNTLILYALIGFAVFALRNADVLLILVVALVFAALGGMR